MTIEKNAQRIKNILAGDYKGRTKVLVGYKKKQIEHKESDVWEEDGKTWTIKDGIKQNVTKLDAIRDFIKMPYICPKCNTPMKKDLDKKFWRMKRQCFDCTIEEDTQKMVEGTFKDYEKELVTKNIKNWMTDIEVAIKDYINSANINNNVTEDGQVETWVGGYSKKELHKIFKKQIKQIKERFDSAEKLKD